MTGAGNPRGRMEPSRLDNLRRRFGVILLAGVLSGGTAVGPASRTACAEDAAPSDPVRPANRPVPPVRGVLDDAARQSAVRQGAVREAILTRVDDKLGEAAERARLKHERDGVSPAGDAILARVDDKKGDAQQRAWLDWPLRDARLVRVLDRRGEQHERDVVRQHHLDEALAKLRKREFPKGTEGAAARQTISPMYEREVEKRRDVRPSSTDATDQHKDERERDRRDEKSFLRDESWRERQIERRDDKRDEKRDEKKEEKAEAKKDAADEKKAELDERKREAKADAKADAAKERAEDRKDRRTEVRTTDERLTKEQP